MLSQPRSRKVAALLALAGALQPLPTGLHKFYLGQKWWGVLYLGLWFTPIPRVASVIEAIWYLIQDPEEFDQNFNDGVLTSEPIRFVNRTRPEAVAPLNVTSVAEALRELDQLRQDGLISEYEFEQKRRKLLDRMG